MKKRILSIVLCFVLIFHVIMPGTAVAEGNVISSGMVEIGNDDEKLDIEELICIQKEEYNTKKTITKNSLQRAKNILSDEKLSEAETNRKILSALGYEEYELEALSDRDLELMVGNGEFITITETYIKMDADGNMTGITYDEYVKKEKMEKSNKIVTPNILRNAVSYNGSYSEDSSDAYMKMIVGATYQSKEHVAGNKGWYYLYTTFRWLKMPKNRKTDIISLGVPSGIAWENKDRKLQTVYSYYYNDIATGKTKLTTGTTSGTFKGLQAGALAADCPLPHFPTLNSLSIYLGGMARVVNEQLITNFNVSCGYAHIKIGSSADVGVSVGPGSAGISFTPKWSVSMTEYGTYLLVRYQPDK